MNSSNINPLRIGLLVTLGILVAGIIIFRLWPAKYTVSIEKSIKEAAEIKSISESELKELLLASGNDITIVDIRDAELFSKSHIQKAVNIPSGDVMTRSNLKKLRKQPVVIYGSNVYEANQTALLLIMAGVDAKPVDINYGIIEETSPSQKQVSISEDTVYNYRDFFKSFEIEEPAPVEIKVPVPKPQGC